MKDSERALFKKVWGMLGLLAMEILATMYSGGAATALPAHCPRCQRLEKLQSLIGANNVLLAEENAAVVTQPFREILERERQLGIRFLAFGQAPDETQLRKFDELCARSGQRPMYSDDEDPLQLIAEIGTTTLTRGCEFCAAWDVIRHRKVTLDGSLPQGVATDEVLSTFDSWLNLVTKSCTQQA